jgi:hypothetical protein
MLSYYAISCSGTISRKETNDDTKVDRKREKTMSLDLDFDDEHIHETEALHRCNISEEEVPCAAGALPFMKVALSQERAYARNEQMYVNRHGETDRTRGSGRRNDGVSF